MSRERQGQRLCRPLYCNHRKTWMRVLDSHQLWLFLSSRDWNYSWNDAQTASLCCSHRCCSLWTRVASYIYITILILFVCKISNQLKLSVLCIKIKIFMFNIEFIIHVVNEPHCETGFEISSWASHTLWIYYLFTLQLCMYLIKSQPLLFNNHTQPYCISEHILQHLCVAAQVKVSNWKHVIYITCRQT